MKTPVLRCRLLLVAKGMAFLITQYIIYSVYDSHICMTLIAAKNEEITNQDALLLKPCACSWQSGVGGSSSRTRASLQFHVLYTIS